MYELGMKKTIKDMLIKDLRPIEVNRRPTMVPPVNPGRAVICGLDQGFGERLFVCQTLKDAKALYDIMANGFAKKIRWYSGELIEGVTFHCLVITSET